MAMPGPTVPDLDGWEAYCEECKAFREGVRTQNHDASHGSEYFNFICTVCHSVMLTFPDADGEITAAQLRTRIR